MELVNELVAYIVIGYLFYPYEEYPTLIKNIKIYLSFKR
jgi:hypothetical protein